MPSQNDLLELHYKKLTEHTTVPRTALGDEALKSIITDSVLSDAYFSTKNIQNIQDTIRYAVYMETKQTIGPQSENDLLIIMRSIYLQYTSNDNNNITEEIQYLNSKVVEYSVKTILIAVYQHMEYMKELHSNLPPWSRAPMDRAQYMSSAGTKDMETWKQFL